MADNRNSAAELVRLREQLKKDLDETSAVLTLLETIGNVQVSREGLKASGIGKTVAKLAKDSRPEVAKAAKPILGKWKTLAKLEKSSSSGSLPVDAKSDTKSEPKPEDEVDEETTVAPARKAGPGLVSISAPSDPKRKKTCDLLLKLFTEDEATFGAKNTRLASMHIESAMCEAFGASTDAYKSMYRTLKANLARYAELRHNIIDGSLPVSELVRMSPDDMLPQDKKDEKQKELDEVFQASQQDWLDKNREEIMKAAGVDVNGGLYICKCGSKKTTHYQKQTRSADEPMTVFVSCLTCGKRWRC
mmetsp:Transcript_11686/g.23023  ORF Transcript_11686/g.23023 Transcript_11686/m.23023 type:complete len:304 (+) Transcript_11686:118-1029(+)